LDVTDTKKNKESQTMWFTQARYSGWLTTDVSMRSIPVIEPLRRMELPLASIVYAIIGCFVLLLTPVFAWIIYGLFPNIPILAWMPVIFFPSMYLLLILGYRWAHKDTKKHDTSTFWLQFVHGLCVVLFATQALFVDRRILDVIFLFCGFLLITFYVSYLALCLAVWTRPPFAAFGAFAISVLSFILTLMRLEP